MAAAIYYLIQIATELGEIKDLLKQGKVDGSAMAKMEDGLSLDSSLSLDSESYAQNLLRKVKEQEKDQEKDQANSAAITPVETPVAGETIRSRDPWAPDQATLNQAALDQPAAEREAKNDPETAAEPAIAIDTAATEHGETQNVGNQNVGKWTREMRRERRLASQPTAPADASEQLTALGTSIAGSVPPSVLTPTPLNREMGQELPLHTPSPMESSFSRVAVPNTPSLENVPAPLAPLAPNSAVQGKPKIWPPEPAGEDALPSFQPEAHKTIDWNIPLD